MARINNHKSSILDMDANVLSFVLYLIISVIGFLPFSNYVIFAIPLIIYVLENKSNFVKQNALQAFVISFGASILYVVCIIISIIARPWCNSDLSRCFGSPIIHKMFGAFGSIRWMIAGFIFVICLVLALRSYNYEEYELNYIDKIIKKVGKFLNKLLGVKPIEEPKPKKSATKVTTKKKTAKTVKKNNSKKIV